MNKELKYLLDLIERSLSDAEECSYRILGTNKDKIFFTLDELDYNIIKDCVNEMRSYINE